MRPLTRTESQEKNTAYNKELLKRVQEKLENSKLMPADQNDIINRYILHQRLTSYFQELHRNIEWHKET